MSEEQGMNIFTVPPRLANTLKSMRQVRAIQDRFLGLASAHKGLSHALHNRRVPGAIQGNHFRGIQAHA